MALRVAIFTADDSVWLLPAWTLILPRLREEFDIAGIHVFPETLAGRRGWDSVLWYLRVFGVVNFVLFGLYAVRAGLARLSGPRTWDELAAKFNVPLRRSASPNDASVVDWVRGERVDVIVITLGQILKKAVLSAPRVGIVNKHAAYLPACRGVYPYFWGKLLGLPTGITFHEVDAGIDTGRILTQAPYPGERERSMSMLRFYMDVFHVIPDALVNAIRLLSSGSFREPDKRLEPTYFSMPTRADYVRFRRAGHRIARWSDLWHIPKIRAAEMGL